MVFDSVVYVKLGHFSLRPSSQRMYSSSAIGDRLFGASSLTSMTGASLDVGRPATTGSFSSPPSFDFRLCGRRIDGIIVLMSGC